MLIDSPDGHGHTTGCNISAEHFHFRLEIRFQFQPALPSDWKYILVNVDVYVTWKFIGSCQVLVI